MEQEVKILYLKKQLSEDEADSLAGNYLKDDAYDVLIEGDTDAYDANTKKLLFKFRKNMIPAEVLKSGYEAFKDSIEWTDGRGMASGGYHKRLKKDGSESNISISNKVMSGNVGYMDASSMVHYCRKTAFARKYFDKFKQGIPFVKYVDDLYAALCPDFYKYQKAIAQGTNRNYVIGDTSFTTVTVNKNFQTSVHKDSGDFQKGFGNLCVYREGNFQGSYFTLPEYRVAVDLHNSDILFVDVHRWHGNTPFHGMGEPYMRIAFVMYFREYMYLCKQPKEELLKIKKEKLGYLKL